MRNNNLNAPVNLVLATLFAGAFVMGCAEMLVVGLVDLIAADLGVSLAAAGSLMTANALGLAVGGPLLTLLPGRFDRRAVLLCATAGFILLGVLPLAVPSYHLFLVARVVIGAAQGLYIGAAITTATSIAAPERAGRAMAVVISGFATASALGLPLGTLLGQAVGWRGSLATVIGFGVVVFVAASGLLPAVPTEQGARAVGQARHAFAPPVLAVLGLCALIFTAIQSALTYLVPYLRIVSGIEGPVVSLFLLAYGVATTAGSALGGRFADANAARTLIVGTLGVAGCLAVLYVFGANAVVAGLCVLGIGLFGMGMAPSMQHRVANLAGPGAPLASSLPASAVNLGIAAGSFLGGTAIEVSGIPAAVLSGAIVALGAVAAAAATSAVRAAEPVGLRVRG